MIYQTFEYWGRESSKYLLIGVEGVVKKQISWGWIYINFIIMQVQSSKGCQNCQKNEQLIQKYLNLIDLLKKKSDMSNLSLSIKQSMDAGTTNNATLQHIKSPRNFLVTKTIELVRKRTLEGFRRMQQKAVQQKCHKGFRLALTLERCIGRRLQEGVRTLWIIKNQTSLSFSKVPNEAERSTSVGCLDSSSNPKNVSCFFPSNSVHGPDKICALSRKIFSMTKQIEALRWSNKRFDEQIKENSRRQEIESKKKKESLEMLAEEMGEKNELISELQTALRFYESRQGRNGNCVLDEDGVALRRELENMQEIQQKLNIQLQKRNDQLAKAEEQLKTLTQKASKSQSENAVLKEKTFEMGVELQNLQKKKRDYNSLTSFLEKKLSNLKKYQKLISSNLKIIEQHSCEDKSSFNISTRMRSSLPNLDDPADGNEDHADPSFSPISQFEAQYKIEKILNYIFNIQLQDVWICNDEKLFDFEELEVLNALKHKFIQLSQQIKSLKKEKEDDQRVGVHMKTEHRLHTVKRDSGEDEVYFNQHHMSGSIFEVLESEKASKPSKESDAIINEFQPRGCPHCNEPRQCGQTATRRESQSFTIRLLELQLQKNKQIQKISQLKNKLMHIRCIVMNLIKSLELKTLKNEARDIVEIFFELFEYSEEEKDVILHQNRKEKKFLGFF